MKKENIISLILKTIVLVSAVVGTLISIKSTANDFMGGYSGLLYFTIQSNIALGAISLAGAVMIIMNRKVNHVLQLIKYMGATSITLTGMVFCIVLAPVIGAEAWNVQNILTHVIVPVLSVVDFFVVGKNFSYKRIEAVWAVLPPILYIIFAGIGFVQNWQFAPGVNYPYFFLNWGSQCGVFGFSKQLPFMGPFWWIAGVLTLLTFLGMGYMKLLKVFGRKQQKNAAE